MRTFIRRLLESRFRISTQLYSGIWGAVALTVAAGLVGWFSFNQVGEAQSVVNEDTVPELASAFGVAQHSSALVDAAPRITTAISQEELDEISTSVAETNAAFLDELATLDESGTDTAAVQQLRSYAESLIANIDSIYVDKVDLSQVAIEKENLQADLATLRAQLDGIVVPALDDQFFFGMTGYRILGFFPAPREEHLSEDQLMIYRHLSEIQANTNISTQLLATTFSLSDASQVEPLRERFEAAAGQIEESLLVLSGTPFHTELSQLFSQLFTLGLGEDGGFNLADRELRLIARQTELLLNNRVLAIQLLAEVDGLVNAARARADEATLASENAILTGRTLLLAISILSVTGAILMAWLFVGRVLLRRINQLSDWMLRMAEGDIETQVEIKGRDEVADMAAALEVFRRHALEVQRLNLVEKLAAELGEKNTELEAVLDDLQRAQEQIVIQEKLAALGELTAGVAHEIRNPLNFVKNFSEASEELLEEFREILDESTNGEVSEDDMSYIMEIVGDLEDNLERIRSHGDRANRIVQDMLMMGRDSGEKRLAQVNDIMHEHMLLAYHSARAHDPDFNLAIEEEYDQNIAELEVIPQDLGRVFLNLVSNACYATDQRRRAKEEAGETFFPEMRLSTHLREDRVEARVWDNGGGIPQENIEKIFNPFFTTKPTDQGTGLGLALSSDIARQHGGLIRVETEPGESTTMIVELPLDDTPLAITVADTETADQPA
ncbi:MAG: ATP-binding protein [bacterium]|nr:ATP-binding protein [bacterium]